eukprot:PLAT13111.2.p1 GENE.PLAT13111.2~~PLAT13111.2.p1  ORF type:complete len:130 (+),score=44.07 PLAT13111.2:49-390(+)
MRVDLRDLSWEDRERVLRLLFAKINNVPMPADLPKHSFDMPPPASPGPPSRRGSASRRRRGGGGAGAGGSHPGSPSASPARRMMDDDDVVDEDMLHMTMDSTGSYSRARPELS